jgi:predicted enzyme related to lactoylglutathione lyase
MENPSQRNDFLCFPVSMGDYEDFNMKLPKGGETVADICHARGGNAALPPQWLVYITVESVEDSAERCLNLGGQLIVAPKSMGSHGKMCVIKDPAGAVCALFESVAS